MSKKQEVTVESEQVSSKFCKDCIYRTCGNKAKREGKSGRCTKTTDLYVSRKTDICDKFKQK